MPQRFGFHLALSIYLLGSSLAVAQKQACAVSASSIVDRSTNVIVERLTLTGPWDNQMASVFRPNKDVVQAAILFPFQN